MDDFERPPRPLAPRLLLAMFLVAFAALLASFPWCSLRKRQPPRLLSARKSTQPLFVGAAHVPVRLPFPVVVAGYGLKRPTVDHLADGVPLEARALVLRSGALEVGVVTVDLLTLPESVSNEVQTRAAKAGIPVSFVAATHVHSSVGSYASGILTQVAGSGRYRPEVKRVLEDAMVTALQEAHKSVEPVQVSYGAASSGELTISRTEGVARDPRLTRFVFQGRKQAVGELVIFAAHPTLVPRPATAVDADFPARLALAEAAAARGVTVFLQGAVGNATPARVNGAPYSPESYARALAQELNRLPSAPVPNELGYATVELDLPPADSSRMVPGFARGAGNLLLCESSPLTARLTVLDLAGVKLLLLPGEATQESAEELETASGASRTVGLVDGYVSYIEPAKRVRAKEGESLRQLFGPELLEELVAASRQAGEALAKSK